jgi:hypothetical protein
MTMSFLFQRPVNLSTTRMKKNLLLFCFSIIGYNSYAQFAKEWKTYYSESFTSENSNYKKKIGDGKPEDFQLRNGQLEINNQTDYSHTLLCNITTPFIRSVHPVHRIKANLGFINDPTSPNSNKFIFMHWNMGHIRFGKAFIFSLFFNSEGEYGFDYYRQGDNSNQTKSPRKTIPSYNKGANKSTEVVVEIELPILRFYFNNILIDSVSVKEADNNNRELQELTFSNSMGSKIYIEDITVSCQQYKPYVGKGTLTQLFPVLMAARDMNLGFTPLIGQIDTNCHKECNRDYSLPASLQITPKSTGFVSPFSMRFIIPMANSSTADFIKMENTVKSLYNSLLPQCKKYELVGKIEKVQLEEDGDQVLLGSFSPKTNMNFEMLRIFYDNRGVHVEVK